jgi:hypothetical protein
MKIIVVWRAFETVKELDSASLTAAHAWYETTADLLKRNFADEWFWCGVAWALTITDGLAWVDGLKLVRELAGAKGEPSDRHGIEAQVQGILKHSPSSQIIENAFILDFGDALLGKTVRTFMGDDVRGGGPVPIDVWAYRDVGFVDPEYKELLRTRFGDEQVSNLKVDTFDRAQYEYAVRFYNELAAELNAIKFGRLKGAA